MIGAEELREAQERTRDALGMRGFDPAGGVTVVQPADIEAMQKWLEDNEIEPQAMFDFVGEKGTAFMEAFQRAGAISPGMLGGLFAWGIQVGWTLAILHAPIAGGPE